MATKRYKFEAYREPTLRLCVARLLVWVGEEWRRLDEAIVEGDDVSIAVQRLRDDRRSARCYARGVS